MAVVADAKRIVHRERPGLPGVEDYIDVRGVPVQGVPDELRERGMW